MNEVVTSDWIAAVSAVVAVGSLVAAAVANVRAKAALQLQHRIDEREREFRQVSWRSGWRVDIAHDEPVVLRVENTGLTDACQVTLVLSMQDGQQVFKLGDVAASAVVDVTPTTRLIGPVAAATLSTWGRGVPYGVHWASPLGQVDTYESKTHTDPPTVGMIVG